MKQLIKKILAFFLCLVPLKKHILLESNPVLGDNTGALYRKMLEKKCNERYKLYWVVPEPKKYADTKEKNVYFIGRKTFADKLKYNALRLNASAIIDCNDQIPKLNPKTLHIYLTHGSPIKSVKDYYYCDPSTDYLISQSEFFDGINSTEFHFPKDKIVALGFARNDDMFSKRADLKQIFGENYEHFIVWYPTYRQHKSVDINTTDISIPVIHDEKNAIAINEAAAKSGTLIIVKPHPAQDLSRIKAIRLSNIIFIGDELFDKHGITSYEFLASTDALVTDYSSVFYDYLLTDKPIGLTFEDYEQYAVKPGFALDTDILKNGSEMLDDAEKFKAFINRVAAGEDIKKQPRESLKMLTNKYTDAHSADRALAFIEEYIGRK